MIRTDKVTEKVMITRGIVKEKVRIRIDIVTEKVMITRDIEKTEEL